MPRQRKAIRPKVSTTIALENYKFLEYLVSSGKAQNISEALDSAVEMFRKLENRRRLEHATAEYFDRLSPKAEQEERALGDALYSSTSGLDFDAEP